MPAFLTLLILWSPTGDPAHEHLNPLYREMVETGVDVGGAPKLRLVAPSLSDGLDAKGQMAAIKALAKQDYALDDLLEPSIVAPHIYRVETLPVGLADAAVHRIDVWFVAYGDFATVTRRDYLEQKLQQAQRDRKVQRLKAEDLTQRGIAVPQNPDEGYSYSVAVILDRVQLHTTSYSVTSRTADSLVLASRVDGRFVNDREYPNQWRLLDPDDATRLGPPRPYRGGGGYVKVTRLAQPKGALFIESHTLFVEPKAWFDGGNLLSAKLPPAISNEVRSLRRELAKTRPGND
ncbi:MAG: hypothetical protein NZ700_00420 [Gemmataceae bacterium]|nr:hypothetical protein [Gemmataceae bacterium]MDW8265442.1 hypothetical protein [Gemmataceae bacterium]